MWFEFKEVPYSFLDTASWIFRSEVEVNMTVDECWKILLDDGAYAKWHPEVQNVEWQNGFKGQGAERTVVFSDAVFNVLLAGPTGIREKFDVWEDDPSKDVRRFSFFFMSATRPSFLTYTAGREEFRVEKTGDGTCKFTRILAVEPGFATRYLLGPIAHSRLKGLIETKVPARFLAAYGEKEGKE